MRVVKGRRTREFDLPTLSDRESAEIALLLKPPRELPQDPLNKPLGATSRQLTDLLQAVSGATTNDSKKRSLEQFAARLLEILPFIRCKHTCLRTRSSEIDIVCEIAPSEGHCILDEFGRHFLVECKNWRKPAGAKEVRDFLGKLQATRCKLGLLFSAKGITGKAHGADAVAAIRSAFDRDGTTIVVLSEDDFASLMSSALEFSALLDFKLDRVRFDL